VRPLVQELNLLFGRVKTAFEAQQHFVADAAHELRTPLAALRLQAQSLDRADTPEARRVAVSRLTAGIDRATRLVEQLLVLARQEATAAEGQVARPVDLADLARRTVADLAGVAAAKGVDLGVQQADPATVEGQPDALQILLRNLVENAVKYTPGGGTVDIAVQHEGGNIVVQVEDSGPGIPPEERERVFDRFYRVAGSDAAGSGLGLAIIKAIAERHGATLTLDSSARLGGLKAVVTFKSASASALQTR
jgi:two-component system OmpR family sensor kinase